MWWSQDRHTGANKSTTPSPSSPHFTYKAPPYPTGLLSCIFGRGDGWLHLSRSVGIFASVCGVFGGGCSNERLCRLWGTATRVQRAYDRTTSPPTPFHLDSSAQTTCLPASPKLLSPSARVIPSPCVVSSYSAFVFPHSYFMLCSACAGKESVPSPELRGGCLVISSSSL